MEWKLVRQKLRENRRRESPGHYHTARARLADFLGSLKPQFRRLLLGIDGNEFVTEWDLLDWLGNTMRGSDRPSGPRFSFGRRKSLRTAQARFLRLLSDVVREWKRDGHAGKGGQVYNEFVEIGRKRAVTKQRGAPPKELAKRADVRFAKSVKAAEARLAPAFKIKSRYARAKDRNRRRRDALVEAGYQPDEIATVLKAWTPHGAAIQLEADRQGLHLPSARASASRGNKAR